VGQTGKNYYVAIKSEPVSIGVPDVTVTGAAKMRLNAITAPHLGQALITPGEIRSDLKTSIPRLGTQAGDATLVADLRPTEHDSWLEASLRGTWATNTLVIGSTRRSYTLETYEADIDTTVLSKGVRFGGIHITGAPDEPVRIEYPIAFIKQAVLTGASAPYYTTPSLTTTEMMVATDAAITIDASPVVDLTAFDLTISNGINLAKVVGTPYSPDVYEGAFTISGTLSMLRSSAVRQTAYLAGTTFALVLTFSVPGSASTLAFTFPTLLASDFSLPLGNDGPAVVTLPVVGGVVGSAEMISIVRVP
jgi:hypothetical protein